MRHHKIPHRGGIIWCQFSGPLDIGQSTYAGDLQYDKLEIMVLSYTQVVGIVSSRVAAKSMEKQIIDQLQESNANKHLRSTAFEMSLFGTGVMKGPFAVDKEYPNWNEEGVYSPVFKTIPQVTNVSVWNFYPDPAIRVRSIAGGFFPGFRFCSVPGLRFSISSGTPLAGRRRFGGDTDFLRRSHGRRLRHAGHQCCQPCSNDRLQNRRELLIAQAAAAE